jgi:uncharacterized protein DUF736
MAENQRFRQAYLSIKLDGPTLAEPIHCALTRHPESAAYRLVWNRRERRAATDERKRCRSTFPGFPVRWV